MLLWASEFQIGQGRHCKNFHIDCTFDLIPDKYIQLFIISTHHYLTNEFMPVAWFLINSKNARLYDLVLQNFKFLLSTDKKFDFNKISFTCDFEPGIINSIKNIFPSSKITGCLFHFKKRLFDKSRELGILKKITKESIKGLIKVLGKLCWAVAFSP